jgi:hypothetical protein
MMCPDPHADQNFYKSPPKMKPGEIKNAVKYYFLAATTMDTAALVAGASGNEEFALPAAMGAYVSAAIGAGLACSLAWDENCQLAWTIAAMGPIGGAGGRLTKTLAPATYSAFARTVSTEGQLWILDAAFTAKDFTEK